MFLSEIRGDYMYYFNNASTSYPKPVEVAKAINEYILNNGTSVNRGTSTKNFDAGEVVYETREIIAGLVGFDNPDNVVFTMNATQGINIILKGFLTSKDHVIVSPFEHNAVLRTLNAIGVEYTVMNTRDYSIDVEDIPELIKENTKMIVMNHASNVSGEILPIKEVGEIAYKHGLEFLIDGSQSLGNVTIDFYDVHASAICFTGHKSLKGPQGIGGFIISDEFEPKVSPLLTGGTGSDSISLIQPTVMPDKFESGTMNMVGIMGLHAGLKNKQPFSFDIATEFINELKKIEGIRIIQPDVVRTPVVSMDFIDLDNAEISFRLEDEYGIVTRCGLHCAPLAHQTLDTYPHGTLRFSFSEYNTKEEMMLALTAIKEIIG